MPEIKHSKQALIEMLIDDDINGFFDRDDQADYLSYILRTGFVGYQDQTYDELLQECSDRGFFVEDENAEE